MAYDSGLTERIADCLRDHAFIESRAMFGGLAFFINGNMLAAVLGDELVVRVGPAAWEGALALPHARKMDFTGRPMRGFVTVDPDGIEDDGDLAAWLDRGIAFAGNLLPKP
ncbi:MAG: TfoX/Sxy family protein [Salinisphaeraceae bacterium]